MSVRKSYSVLINGRPVITDCSYATAKSVYQSFQNHFDQVVKELDPSFVAKLYGSIVIAFDLKN